MFDYANARIAARRSRLLDGPALERLATATTAGALVDLLSRSPDWRAPVQAAEAATSDAAAALALAVELHRSARLGDLPGLVEPLARGPVEALVLLLDLERVLAVLRRHHGRLGPDDAVAAILPGALLDLGALRDVARHPAPAAVAHRLTRAGILDPEAAALIAALAGAQGVNRDRDEPPWPAIEAAVTEAFDRARRRRVNGRSAPAATVRAILAEEQADRGTAEEELATGGPAAAALVERGLVLRRLRPLADAGRRDTLGIGPIAGYVAAVELQAIRLRLALARVASGWSAAASLSFLPPGGRLPTTAPPAGRSGGPCEPTIDLGPDTATGAP